MGQVHSKRNVYQSQYLNIGDYDNVYESTQMCAYCDVNWVGNMHDHKSTSSYVFLLGNGVVNWNNKSNPLLLCHQHKLNIWQLHKQQSKQCGFHHFLGALVFHKWNPWSYMMTIKIIYLYQRTQFFMFTQNISGFIIIWCKRNQKKSFVKLVYYNVKNMVVDILTNLLH